MLPKGWGRDGKTDVKEVKWDGHKEVGGGGAGGGVVKNGDSNLLHTMNYNFGTDINFTLFPQ